MLKNINQEQEYHRDKFPWNFWLIFLVNTKILSTTKRFEAEHEKVI